MRLITFLKIPGYSKRILSWVQKRRFLTNQLYNQCLKLAKYLNSSIGEKQNILLLAPNSVFFITAYLAILKSGNVVVPLNPEIEQSNLDFIQEKCTPDWFFPLPI